jgi:hypothetical protein
MSSGHVPAPNLKAHDVQGVELGPPYTPMTLERVSLARPDETVRAGFSFIQFCRMLRLPIGNGPTY